MDNYNDIFDVAFPPESIKAIQRSAENIKNLFAKMYAGEQGVSRLFNDVIPRAVINLAIASPGAKSNTVNLAKAFEHIYSKTVIHLDQIEKTAQAMQAAVESAAWKQMVESINAARPYMTEEQSEELDAIVEPEPGEDVHTPKRLTFGQWTALLGLVLQLIQIILMQLPDEQLEEISRQNETILVQQTEQTELLRQLSDTASDIFEVLETFQQDSDQPEDLTDLDGLPGDDAAEIPDGDGEPEHLAAEDENDDDLEQQDDR